MIALVLAAALYTELTISTHPDMREESCMSHHVDVAQELDSAQLTIFIFRYKDRDLAPYMPALHAAKARGVRVFRVTPLQARRLDSYWVPHMLIDAKDLVRAGDWMESGGDRCKWVRPFLENARDIMLYRRIKVIELED
jgi:hypothetical protein